jgi:hypothetical protein
MRPAGIWHPFLRYAGANANLVGDGSKHCTPFCYNRTMRLHDYASRPAHLKWLLDSDPAIRRRVIKKFIDLILSRVVRCRARRKIERALRSCNFQD